MQRTCISLLCGQSRLAIYNSLPSSVGGNILRGRGGQILCKTILIHKTYSKEQQKGWGWQEEYEKRKSKIWQQLQQVRGPNFFPFFLQKCPLWRRRSQGRWATTDQRNEKQITFNYYNSPQINTQAQQLNIFQSSVIRIVFCCCKQTCVKHNNKGPMITFDILKPKFRRRRKMWVLMFSEVMWHFDIFYAALPHRDIGQLYGN